tara:strand:+ start:46 stop:456 length:411 start_codon:yes stop_codon:yes gene_type:complete
MDIEELFEAILSKPAEPPKSIDLSFVNEIELKDLFEFLLQFFTEISKTFFSNDDNIVELEQLSELDLKRINNYIQSIGFSSTIDIFPTTALDIFDIARLQNGKYNKINITHQTKLKDLYFTLKCKETIYKISFDYI